MQITVTTEDDNIVSVDVDPETVVENLKASHATPSSRFPSQIHRLQIAPRPRLPSQPTLRYRRALRTPLRHTSERRP